MSTRLISVLGFALLTAHMCSWGGTAQLQMSNNSIRMYPGPCSCGFGLVWNLHFSSHFTEDPLEANGELARRPSGSPTTHWAYMILEDPSMFSSVTVAEIDLPVSQDLNGNGVPDFFELSRGITTATSGSYGSSIGGGTLTLSWSRSAGSAMGSCVLYMNDKTLGRIGPFNHQFEVRGYTGSLTYQNSDAGVSGTVALNLGGQTSWQGPVSMTRSPSDPINTLALQAGTWTNAYESLSFEAATLTRDPSRPSMYRGTLKGSSGDFSEWTVWIVDTTDSNGNGIPDLSDDVQVQPPQPPSLRLRMNANRVELEINGQTGRPHQVQTSTVLNSVSWDTVTTVTLTNETQVIELTPPATGSRFWRVKVD